MSSTTVTFLGTGTSVGVPVIGCDCPVCSSAHPGNQRSRCSIHLQSGDTSILVDTGPDLRQQALRENLRVVDAVFYTHSHLDHIAGFDELRAFCWHREGPLPLYAGPETHLALRGMFPWAFEHRNPGYVRPEAIVIEGPVTFGPFHITPVPVVHAGIETFGYRFELPSGHSMAYFSDVKRFPETSLPFLENLDLLVIDALREEEHATHLTLAESRTLSERLRPHQTLFTHLAHELDFEAASAGLPANMALAQDGMRLRFPPGEPCAIVPPTAAPSA